MMVLKTKFPDGRNDVLMTNTRDAYFAAANTAAGFVSSFSELFDAASGEWNKIYILKGGPGTGKSGFLRKTADAAEKRGYKTERFYCSSDTRSLDGVRIPELGVALLDGTAPHMVDPKYPGAVEEILNLGMFFDAGVLREHTTEIRALSGENASHHARAARYLRAAGEMRQVRRGLLDGAFLPEKAARAAQRIVRLCPTEKTETVRAETRFATANSTQGYVHLPSAENSAAHLISVGDKNGIAAGFLSALVTAAKERGVSYVRYADPLLPSETEGIYLPGCDTVYLADRFGAVREDAEHLNATRFYDSARLGENREKLRFAAKCETALLDGAYEALASAGNVHDALETYYISAMDFRALDAYTARFLKSVFG